MKFIAMLALGLFLSGCAGQIAKIQTVSDKAGQVALKGPCAMLLGAYVRLPEDMKKVVMPYAERICPKTQ